MNPVQSSTQNYGATTPYPFFDDVNRENEQNGGIAENEIEMPRNEAYRKMGEASAYAGDADILLSLSTMTSIGVYAIDELVIPPDSPLSFYFGFTWLLPVTLIVLAAALKIQAYKLRGEAARSMASLPV